jgi:hypothetical protein
MTSHSDLVAKVRQAIEAAQLNQLMRGHHTPSNAVAEAAIAAVADFIQEGK